MNERTIKPIAVAVGTVFAAALATAAVAQSDGALFAVDELDRGYDRLADAHGDAEEGSCGEGKCGEDKDKDKDKDGEEGSCGEGEDGEEGSCGEGEDGEEGSCGEGEDEKADA